MIAIIIIASLLTITLWVPYFLAWLPTKGPQVILSGNPKQNSAIQVPSWAERLVHAHQNAVENLAAFIGVCLAAHLAGEPAALALQLGWIYILARLVHYLSYGFGIPVLRTAAFMAGWFSTFGIGVMTINQLI